MHKLKVKRTKKLKIKELMSENEISKIIVDVSYKIHTQLGPGLLESVYETILDYELTSRGLKVERQKALPVIWNETKMDIGFRADLIVENKVIIEVKSVEQIALVHPKQVLTYLKITGLKLGLLINFNEYYIKDGIKRIVNNLLFVPKIQICRRIIQRLHGFATQERKAK